MAKVSFADGVYSLCSQIPRGGISTYGGIAKALNSSSRAVGQALRCNPYAPVVPCHRIVCSDGRIGGFMGEANGPEVEQKVRLLREEGVVVQDGLVDRFEKIMFCTFNFV